MKNKLFNNLKESGNPKFTIGALLDVISDLNHQRYWLGLAQGALKNNVNLLIFPESYLSRLQPVEYKEQNIAMVNLANNSNLDSLIIWASTFSWILTKDKFEGFFQNVLKDPSILIFKSIPDDIPIILMGSYKGMKDIMEHLIKVHGYRRIAFIRGPEFHLGSIERYRAYKDALALHDIPYNPDLVSPPLDKFWLRSAGADMIELLLERNKKNIDAVVTVNDIMAYGAYNLLINRGIKIPGDIALIGFDNYPLMMSIMPSLTTVDPGFEELGRKTVDMFIDIVNGKNIPLKQEIPHKLIIRHSCGCSDPAVIQAYIKPETINISSHKSRNSLNNNLIKEKENIISEIKLEAPSIDDNAVRELLNAVINDVENEDSSLFIAKLEQILEESISSNDDMLKWHNFFSLMRPCVLKHLEKKSLILKAENLFQQARIMIGHEELQVYKIHHGAEKDLHDELDKIEKEIITIFNINKLMDRLALRLPSLGIPSFYLSLYEAANLNYEASRLILAYNNGKRLDIEDNGKFFLTIDLLLKELITGEKCYIFIIEPLYFHEEQLGFIILEMGPRSGFIYEKLRNDISNAVKGAILVKEMDERTKELDKAYKALQENQQRLIIAEKMAGIGQLAGGLSHEINNPIGVILGFAQSIVKRMKENDPLFMPLKSIEREALRCKKLVIDLMTFSRSDISQRNASDKIAINDIIDEILILMENHFKIFNIEVVKKYGENLPVFIGNKGQIQQILINLLNNALEAMPTGGIITITTRYLNKHVELIIEDTGVGMTEEVKKHIFEPFFTTKEVGKGTGLGLSLCYEMIKSHGGTIDFESEKGKGSVFKIKFQI